MKLRSILLLAALSAAGPLSAAGLIGEKLDTGLGELPHYSKWLDKTGRQPMGATSTRVPGESLDSGLGELPHYRHWKDKRGRDPLGHGAWRLAERR